MKQQNVKRLLLTVGLCTVMFATTGCGNKEPEKQTEEVVQEEVSEEAVEEKAPVAEEAETEAEPEVPQLDGYDLIWNDEFDGEAMDESIWSYEPHEPGWTNEELQEYTESTDNVFLRDGKMVIKAIKTEKDGKEYYTSGKVKTQNKQDFLYGKVVASAKVPQGQGLWPAIWMMPTEESYYVSMTF